MVQEMAPAGRRRLGAHGTMLRRRRIFARLREGLSYEEIANEEGVSSERVRQIVADVLQKRSVDSGAAHAKLQLDRLAPVMQLAAEAVAAGDVTAIAPYLKVLDPFDRYQTVAGANQAMTTRRARSCSRRSTASPSISTWTRSCARRRANTLANWE
jgi:DNA-binding CsgD family transcriptional regulator